MSAPGRYVLGVDTGGTFTDIVCLDERGAVVFDKAFSTPDDPAEGVLAALDRLAAQLGLTRQALLRQTRRFAHGTTVSTNALIQRRGARVGLLLTHGFEDTLVIGRGPMGRTGGLPPERAMDFLRADPPAPLVPRDRVRGLHERVTRDGAVLVPLDPAEVERALGELLAQGIDSLAVCLLWSFRNPAHERLVRAVAQRLAPELPVSLSCEVSPVLGEFERAMTTVVNAYVGPTTTHYIQRLAATLEAEGLRTPLQVMKASGGTCLPARVGEEAVALINSGPVGGLVAAQQLGALLGRHNLITTDMGGTSFDVGIIYRGEYEVERVAFIDQGVPIQVPAARIVAIGAGGGSIAWTDGRRLLLGPHSAGARPGPACYGLGGTEPTVTDALVVLGILDPAYFLGGRRRLDRARAAEALARVGAPLGLSIEETAAGVYEIVNARMADLVRKVTVERGLDPRQFTLVSYGGAGPAHCAHFAAALGVDEVLIPFTSAVFSALGCALADVLLSYARSEPVVLAPAATAVERANRALADLERQARADLARLGIAPEQVSLVRRLDVRYEGQMNEVTIAWDRVPLAPDDLEAVRQRFEALYEARFGAGTTRPGMPVELITFRLEAVQRSSKPSPQAWAEASPPSATPLPRTTRTVYTRRDGRLPHAVYAFADLRPGMGVPGPAIIERADTTVYVPAGHQVRMDVYRHLHLRPASSV